MKVILVDEADNIIGYKERNDRSEEDIIRISGLWILNSQKEVLIAQRSFNKVHDPGKWGPSAAGTVEQGETYASNIVKEAKEELGVHITEKDLIPLYRTLRKTSHRYFVQMFAVKLDLALDSLVVQKEEVEAVRWVAMKDLSSWMQSKPEEFIASFPNNFKAISEFLSKGATVGF